MEDPSDSTLRHVSSFDASIICDGDSRAIAAAVEARGGYVQGALRVLAKYFLAVAIESAETTTDTAVRLASLHSPILVSMVLF